MTKIDLHLHCTRTPVPRTDKGFVSTAAEMVPHLEELGIEKAVLLSAGETGGMMACNEDLRCICEEDPAHFAWMCNLDPVEPETIRQRLARYKARGAVGIGELMINRRLDDPLLREIFSAAGELGLPVTFHMSPRVGFGYGVVDDPGLPLLEKTLQDFPDTIFLGHSQPFWIEMSGDAPTDPEGRNAWGQGPVVPGGRVPALFEKYPNLYGDLSANSAGCALMRDPEFGLAFLERYANRLFFATDMVNTEMVFPLGAWLDRQFAEGRLSRAAYESVCRKNAERVFGL